MATGHLGARCEHDRVGPESDDSRPDAIHGRRTGLIDELVEDRVGESRSAVIRQGVRHLAEAVDRRRVGTSIAQSYREHPQTSDDDDLAMARSPLRSRRPNLGSPAEWLMETPNREASSRVCRLTRRHHSFLNTVVVAPVTNTLRDIPTRVPVGQNEGINHDSLASFDKLAALPRPVRENRCRLRSVPHPGSARGDRTPASVSATRPRCRLPSPQPRPQDPGGRRRRSPGRRSREVEIGGLAGNEAVRDERRSAASAKPSASGRLARSRAISSWNALSKRAVRRATGRDVRPMPVAHEERATAHPTARGARRHRRTA